VHEADAEPAALLRAELARLRAAGAPALDLACGRGRNALALAREGLATIALDRERARLAALAAAARANALPVFPLLAELEAGGGIPLASASCGAVLVFRYLHRPLAPEIVRVLRPGGLLLYETFTVDQAGHGKPTHPDFLLQHGELRERLAALTILRERDGIFEGRYVAGVVARKP
jgi:tellurite methyltransferase